MTRIPQDADETAIRGLIAEMAAATAAKDVDGALRHNAPDLVRYDLAPPLARAGADALDRDALADWFATWQGPLGYQTRDMEVVTGGDLACCHGFVRISGVKTDGARADLWARQTLCLRKADGAWKVFHEHMSVPFYMDGSFKAAVDLVP